MLFDLFVIVYILRRVRVQISTFSLFAGIRKGIRMYRHPAREGDHLEHQLLRVSSHTSKTLLPPSSSFYPCFAFESSLEFQQKTLAECFCTVQHRNFVMARPKNNRRRAPDWFTGCGNKPTAPADKEGPARVVWYYRQRFTKFRG